MQHFKTPAAGDKIAVLKTSKGDIRVMFFPDAAPRAVENFITHAQNGFYDGVIFHRVIPGFMVQSGDPQGTGRGGQSIWGRPFENEASEEYRNFRGALAMANAGPDTNGSQFYIVQAGTDDINDYALDMTERRSGAKIPAEAREMYKQQGGAPWLDGGYTVFGRVLEGMDVVDVIAAVETDGRDKPLKPIVIQSVAVETVK